MELEIFKERKAQVSFEYLLTAVFGMFLAITAALVLETLRQVALEAQAEMLSERARLIENTL